MIAYLTVCIISILTGRGILRLTNIKLESALSLYLAPVLTLSFWSIFLGVGILNNYTVNQLWPLGWLLTLGLAVLGLISLNKDFDFKKNWLNLLAVFIFPILLMAPFFWWGLTSYFGSGTPDGWAYVAYGQYLWKYTRGTEGGLAPLYQYVASIGQARFISGATLGFFSPLTGNPGDIQSVSNLFLAWTMFVFSASCMFFASTQRLGKFKIVYLVICIFSGWLVRLLWVNNFDNALSLAFLPALAGIVTLTVTHERKWAIIFSLPLAAVIYCYPEMTPVIFFGVGLFLLDQIVKHQQSIKEWFVIIFITLVLISIMAIPFIEQSILFFLGQFHAAMQPIGNRPGEGLFNELLNRSYWEIGFWGLITPVVFHTISVIGSNCLAIILNVLIIFGLIKLIKQRQWGISIYILALYIGTLIMIFHYNYSYGAYKFILFNWWAVCFAIVTAIKALLMEQQYFKLKMASSSLVLLTFLLFNSKTLMTLYNTMPIKNISYYKQLEEIKPLVDKYPIVVTLDDGLANEWGVYFLRTMTTHLTEYRNYMSFPTGMHFMQRAQKVKLEDCNFLLTDNPNSLPKSFLVWSGGPYYLWRLRGIEEKINDKRM